MGNIKVRDKEGNWVVVASNQASGRAVDDPALVEEDEKSSVQDVLVNHEERDVYKRQVLLFFLFIRIILVLLKEHIQLLLNLQQM